MPLKIEGVPSEVQREVNEIAAYFCNQFGCIANLNEEFPSNGICVAVDVSLPKNKEIFFPVSKKVSVFKIDTKKELMTIMYFPEEKDNGEVLIR